MSYSPGPIGSQHSPVTARSQPYKLSGCKKVATEWAEFLGIPGG